MAFALTAFLALGLATGCSDEGGQPTAPGKSSQIVPDEKPPPPTPTPTPTPPPPEPMDPQELAEKGRQTYLSSCIACHNPDPSVDGALGPAVAGSSAELIEARVMRAEYPEGYTPKRETQVMVAMPFLEKHLPALAAYLAPAG